MLMVASSVVVGCFLFVCNFVDLYILLFIKQMQESQSVSTLLCKQMANKLSEIKINPVCANRSGDGRGH